ncbi:MAG: hypothetical protein JWP63_1287 [Candidatus Solibacter sp.]|nr:hypothetical protein [Candidatus Solibacter sp.]
MPFELARTIGYRAIWMSALLLALSTNGSTQGLTVHDPGVRGGNAGAGEALPGISGAYNNLFVAGLAKFSQEDQVVQDGLGPRMNLNSCGGCHAAPAAGGSSPKINPQFAFVNSADHGNNTLPSFITRDGPTREARFKKTSLGNRTDGGVHNLFTISGMKGAQGCVLQQPDFEAELARKNLIFRIPTPVFGAGLIEQIPDRVIVDNLNNPTVQPEKSRMRVGGRVNVVVSGNTRTEQIRTQGEPNRNGNDGTIARFGWKAQNKSLLLFAAEAYNVEMGISSELFQTEREENPTCQFRPTPNDFTDPTKVGTFDLLSDIEKFASFMRLLAPPQPSESEPGGPQSIANGRNIFKKTGCVLCHSETLKTGNSVIPQLSNQTAHLFSDLALHQMGPNLDDGISQGEAKPNEFRTPPLWGLGQRLFFLHDGRTKDLLVAIQEHRGGKGPLASEANEVVKRFDRLSTKDKQDLLNFLRSL